MVARAVCCLSLLVLVATGRAPEAQQPGSREAPFDLLLRGGWVVDGTGRPGRLADIGVRNGYAERDEMVALARMAGEAGGVYATHMRSEGTALEAAVEESLAVGEAAGTPVEISCMSS